MSGAVFSAFLAFTLITAFTPGPNNILAMSAGMRHGFRGSIPIVSGICAGFFSVMLLCCVVVFSLSAFSKHFIAGMNWVGCLYILWLAWKVTFANPVDGRTAETQMGFASGFVLQFVNIKIIIYGITALSSFILPYYDSHFMILGFAALLTLIGSAGVLIWALAGSALQRFFCSHARIINAVMGIMLLACALALVC